MDWLAFLFNVQSTHRIRLVFEEGMPAHQPIRRWRGQRLIDIVDASNSLRVTAPPSPVIFEPATFPLEGPFGN
jgi:hypothetical protein